MKKFLLICCAVMLLCSCQSKEDKAKVNEKNEIEAGIEDNSLQLQRNILGLELGKSTREETINHMKELDIPLSPGAEHSILLSFKTIFWWNDLG